MLRGQPEAHGLRGRDQSNHWGKGRGSGPNGPPGLRYGTAGLEARRKAVRQQATEPGTLTRISHHLTVEARDKPAITALRLLAVLNVLFKYASARRAARALY